MIDKKAEKARDRERERRIRREEAGIKKAIWLRNYQRVRGRALVRLAQENPDRYRELFEQERARDEAEGKSWLDIGGRTISSLGSAIPPDRQGGISERYTNGNGQEDSDNGGEA